MPDDLISQARPRKRTLRRDSDGRRDSAGWRDSAGRREALARQMQAVRQAQAGRRGQVRAWRVGMRRVLPALAIVSALALSLAGHPEVALPVWLGVVVYGAIVIHLDWRDRMIAQEVRRLRAESRLMSAEAEEAITGPSQVRQDERAGEQP